MHQGLLADGAVLAERINQKFLNLGNCFFPDLTRDRVRSRCFTSGKQLTDAITACMAVLDRNSRSHESNAGGIQERRQICTAPAKQRRRREIVECYLRLSSQIRAL